MKYLGYCVFRAGALLRGKLPAGVAGAKVSMVTDGELAAAISRVPNGSCAPSATNATAYADVIAALSASRTVLPLRYGCFFSSTADVHDFLAARRAEFSALLDRLDGCVEMGVRVLVTSTSPRSGGRPSRPTGADSGAAYLAARSAAYVRNDAGRAAGAVAAAAVRRAFHNLSVQSRTVFRRAGENLLVSLYFLVRRDHLDAIYSKFRRLQEHGKYRLLLSGPWAPYNFVGGSEPGVER